LTRTFSFSSAAETDIGDYVIEVTGTDSYTTDTLTGTFTLTVSLSNNPPIWLLDFLPIVMLVSEEYDYFIPGYIDPDPDHVLTINFE